MKSGDKVFLKALGKSGIIYGYRGPLVIVKLNDGTTRQCKTYELTHYAEVESMNFYY